MNTGYGKTGNHPVKKKRTTCSMCGKTATSQRYGITGDDNSFLCNWCYQELLCPSSRAGRMEMTDEKFAPLRRLSIR